MNVYSYVITTDAGSAPNYGPPRVTLAVCKPRIRRVAKLGDLIIAFSGANLGREPHGVRWAGVVAEKLSFAQYWHDLRFQGKKPGASETPDNIYRPEGSRLVQVRNKTHRPDQTPRDTRGAYVLAMDPSWRFGGGAPVLPAEFPFRMPKNARRNHRVISIDPAMWGRVRRWLDAQAAGGSRGDLAALARLSAGRSSC